VPELEAVPLNFPAVQDVKLTAGQPATGANFFSTEPRELTFHLGPEPAYAADSFDFSKITAKLDSLKPPDLNGFVPPDLSNLKPTDLSLAVPDLSALSTFKSPDELLRSVSVEDLQRAGAASLQDLVSHLVVATKAASNEALMTVSAASNDALSALGATSGEVWLPVLSGLLGALILGNIAERDNFFGAIVRVFGGITDLLIAAVLYVTIPAIRGFFSVTIGAILGTFVGALVGPRRLLSEVDELSRLQALEKAEGFVKWPLNFGSAMVGRVYAPTLEPAASTGEAVSTDQDPLEEMSKDQDTAENASADQNPIEAASTDQELAVVAPVSQDTPGEAASMGKDSPGEETLSKDNTSEEETQESSSIFKAEPEAAQGAESRGSVSADEDLVVSTTSKTEPVAAQGAESRRLA